MKTKTKIVLITAAVIVPLFLGVGYAASRYNLLHSVETSKIIKS